VGTTEPSDQAEPHGNKTDADTLTREIITRDRERAARRLWSDRPEEQLPYDARLATLLWTGPPDV
jgi:hypothetical protein